jgi:hypothetical protein
VAGLTWQGLALHSPRVGPPDESKVSTKDSTYGPQVGPPDESKVSGWVAGGAARTALREHVSAITSIHNLWISLWTIRSPVR